MKAISCLQPKTVAWRSATTQSAGDSAGSHDASAAEIGPLLERYRPLLKGFEHGRIDRLKACSHTVTDDARFVVETRDARGWVMSPCSGHGSEFGAEMGLELRPHDCRWPRSGRPRPLGGRSGRR